MREKIKSFLSVPFYDKLDLVINKLYLLKTMFWYRPFFKKVGKNSRIIKPLRLNGTPNIILGSNVTVNRLTWLLTLQISHKKPELILDDGATIGNLNHITCVNRVYIGQNVLTADKVYISDNLHGYENIDMPIKSQPILDKGEVIIGENSWIGENVSILSCKIGKHCIIGSNSVVTKDIPDYSIAVGIPARVIKRFNLATKQWELVKRNE